MDTDEAYRHIEKKKPKVLHVTGKTSTGKSTFASNLHDALGYKVIELDQVVHDSVMAPLEIEDRNDVFIEVYKKRNKLDWIQRFTDAVQKETNKEEPVVINGAIANITTMREVLVGADAVEIIYFHPQNLDVYERNLKSRFTKATPSDDAGIPRNFWNLIDASELTAFYATREITPGIVEGITLYAQQSKASSVKRLQKIRAAFPDILVVDV